MQKFRAKQLEKKHLLTLQKNQIGSNIIDGLCHDIYIYIYNDTNNNNLTNVLKVLIIINLWQDIYNTPNLLH